MYSWILIVDSSSKHSLGHVERLSSGLFRSSCNDCFDFILFHFLCPPWGELLINQGNKLKDEWTNSRELLIAWALGFELEEQLVPHRGLLPAAINISCLFPKVHRLTSPWLLGSFVFPYPRGFCAWCKHLEDCRSTIFHGKTQIPQASCFI